MGARSDQQIDIEYWQHGFDHFDRVLRSWEVFRRNAGELVTLLHQVESDRVASFRIMGVLGQPGNDEDLAFQREFWSQLDQRLHNMVSSAISLVDHTRPLTRFYGHNEEFSKEYETRATQVRDSPVAAFLRRLRNYLLHCGMPPTAHSLQFGNESQDGSSWDRFEINLSADGLLRWGDWTAGNRDYIASFRPGPPLRKVAEEYIESMANLYKWLYSQRDSLHPL